MFAEICREQHGILSRKQLMACGFTHAAIRARVKSRRWRPLGRGVYATFSGELSPGARHWSALLRCGDGAILSHHSAAEWDGIADGEGRLIHVTIPGHRRIDRLPGIVVHHSGRIDEIRHPTRSPPRTRVEETVLDLAVSARTLDDAIATMSTAVGRRVTTPARLVGAIDARSKLRWRAGLLAALADIEDGCHSLLEVRYLRGVERVHGLPRGRRQAPGDTGGTRIFRDVRYEAYATVVELDGRVAHPAGNHLRDLRRDNIEARTGGSVLHFGWTDVVDHPCDVASDVVGALRAHAWRGVPRRCGNTCSLPVIR